MLSSVTGKSFQLVVYYFWVAGKKSGDMLKCVQLLSLGW